MAGGLSLKCLLWFLWIYLVDVQYLNYKDIEQLNNYHKQVYNVLSPYMKGEELEQLVYSTREL